LSFQRGVRFASALTSALASLSGAPPSTRCSTPASALRACSGLCTEKAW
jgi:hypothetical protein